MVRANRFCESLSCSASACIGRAGGADQLEIASCVDRASLGTRKGFFDDKVRVVKVVKGGSRGGRVGVKGGLREGQANDDGLILDI